MSGSDAEDPFAAFGESDDDSDAPASAVPDEPRVSAKTLVDRANAGTKAGPADAPSPTTASPEQRDVPIASFRKHELPWPDPLYTGPIELVSLDGMGGGRGYVASQPLQPGTLVLVEQPVMPWPKEQLGRALGLVSVRRILEHPEATGIVRDMEELHPTKRHVDASTTETASEQEEEQVSGMMNVVRKEIARGDVSDLVRLARQRGVSNSDGSSLQTDDILRLFLALRYNGLESGIYRHSAMLNHSCFPNCAKLVPTNGHTYSEVRTTRPVAEGEALTISYIAAIRSHATRRKHLWDQHRFDIGSAYLKGVHLKMDLVNGALPTSNVNKWDENTVTCRIEKSLDDLERLLQEYSVDIAAGTVSPEIWEHAKALEVSAQELYNESLKRIHNDQHILLVPSLSLHVEACQLVLKSPLSNTARLKLLARSTKSAHRLAELQRLLLGNDHFDIARTCLDVADAVGELLSRSPKHLIELNVDGLDSFSAWKSLEARYRAEFRRIKSMYPEDTAQFLT